MKRRSKVSGGNPKSSSPIPKRPHTGGFHGVWSANTRFRPTKNPKPKDTFEENWNPNASLDASEVPKESNEASKSDGPKTSEYAFFKKLKKDSGRSFHPYSLEKKDKELEKPESSCILNIDMVNKVRHSFKNLKSSCLEKVAPKNPDSFMSPYLSPSKSWEIAKTVKNNIQNHQSSVPTEKVVPMNFDSFPSPSEGPRKSSETQNSSKDVFSTKRQRLREWIANTSSPGTSELHLKGYNLVSILLNRLLPENNENNDCLEPENQKSDQGYIDTKYDFSKSHWTAFNDSMELEHMLYKDDYKSMKSFLSNWDNAGYEHSPRLAENPHFQNTIREINLEIYGKRPTSLYVDTELPASNHHLLLYEFHCTNSSSHGKNSNIPLLDWDFNKRIEEHGSSCASRNTELTLYHSALSTPVTFPSYYVRNYYSFDSERHLLEEKRNLDTALMVSFKPGYFDVAENSSYDFDLAMNQPLFLRDISSENYLQEKRLLCLPSKNDYDSFIENSSQEETLQNQIDGDDDRPSSNFQTSLLKEKEFEFPLLIHDSSWDKSEGYTNSDW